MALQKASRLGGIRQGFHRDFRADSQSVSDDNAGRRFSPYHKIGLPAGNRVNVNGSGPPSAEGNSRCSSIVRILPLAANEKLDSKFFFRYEEGIPDNGLAFEKAFPEIPPGLPFPKGGELF